jgi:probable phosphoglycerate mutase
VLLVRHGKTATTGLEMPAPGSGPELSDEGIAQAEATAERLASWRPSLPELCAIYASPFLRTKQTAGVIAKALGLAPQDEPRLVDCDVGEWAGMSFKELSKRPEWATVVRFPSGFRFPGGDSMLGMQARVVGAVRDLAGRHPGKSIVVVSHADPIKAVVADALGMYFDMFQRIVVSPASVSAVCYTGSEPSVIAVNWTGSPAQLPQLAKAAARRRPVRRGAGR